MSLGAATVTVSVSVSGWAADRNTRGPVDVLFGVNSRLRPERVTASGDRPDVGAAHGPRRVGYTVTLPVRGANTSTLVCVSALNAGPGASSMLGYRRAKATPPETTPPRTTPPTTTVPEPPPWLDLGDTVRLSVASDGTQGDNHSSDRPRISADGRYVTFYSGASNLVSGDTNNKIDVFVHRFR